MSALATEPFFDIRSIDPENIEAWTEFAACAGTNGTLDYYLFPESSGPSVANDVACRDCIVKDQCLEYALIRPQLKGVWGGTSEAGRKRLRRAMRVPAVDLVYDMISGGSNGQGSRVKTS